MIFQRASCTAVCLGPMDKSAKKVMTSMTQLDVQKRRRGDCIRHTWNIWTTLRSLSLSSPVWLFILGRGSQELGSSRRHCFRRKLTVLIGDHEYYWEALELGGRFLEDRSSKLVFEWDFHAEWREQFNTPCSIHDRRTHIVLDHTFLRGVHLHSSSRFDERLDMERHALVLRASTHHSTSDLSPETKEQVSILRFSSSHSDGPHAEALRSFRVLVETSHLDCQDPRDRVFAVHSLVSTSSRAMAADYDKDMYTVFADLSSCLISHGILGAVKPRVCIE